MMIFGVGRHGERGQAIPLIAFGLLAIIGSSALAVDAGYWRYEQRLQQSAADSAAIAGGVQSDFTPYLPTIQSAGQADAAANGFTNGVNNTTVTINRPPSTGPNAGNARAVEAIVTKEESSFFSQIFGTVATVSTRAVAVPSNTGADCIVALNRNLQHPVGITLNGTGSSASHIYAPSCAVLTDSIITVNGSAATVTAAQIGYVAGDTNNGHPSFPEAQPTSAAYVADPCSSVTACYNFTNEATRPVPYPTGAPTYDSTLIAQTPNPAPTTINGVYTYSPGVYTSELKPPATASSVNFLPGVYTLDVPGTQPSLDLSNLNATGTGVVFYNEAGAFKVSGNNSATYSFTAPSDGQFAGLVYYQPSANTNDVTWQANGNTIDFSGFIYLPGAQLKLNGIAPHVTSIVADSIVVDGGGITAAPPNGTTPTVGHFVLAE